MRFPHPPATAAAAATAPGRRSRCHCSSAFEVSQSAVAVLSMLAYPAEGREGTRKVGSEEVRSEERRGERKGVCHTPLVDGNKTLLLLILAPFSEAAAGPVKVVYRGRRL